MALEWGVAVGASAAATLQVKTEDGDRASPGDAGEPDSSPYPGRVSHPVADWSAQWNVDQLEWFLLAATADRETARCLEKGVLPPEAMTLSPWERDLLRRWLPGSIPTIAARLNALLTGQFSEAPLAPGRA